MTRCAICDGDIADPAGSHGWEDKRVCSTCYRQLVPAIGAPAADFALAEYVDRRNDILQRTARIEGQVRFGLLVSGGVWTWLLMRLDGRGSPWIPWVPVVLVFYLANTWYAEYLAIRGIAAYILEVEHHFQLPGNIGWESNLRKYQGAYIRNFAGAFWVLLLLTDTAAAACFAYM